MAGNVVQRKSTCPMRTKLFVQPTVVGEGGDRRCKEQILLETKPIYPNIRGIDSEAKEVPRGTERHFK